jgi:phosphoglycerate dehydrogenase-like enzyme
LKFIHIFSAGTDHIQKHPIYTDTDIPLTTSSGIHGPQIAEWAILQTLSLTHRSKFLIEAQKKHVWASHAEYGMVRDSVGQRLGVLGYGSIGRQSQFSYSSNFEKMWTDGPLAARLFKALGGDVIAFTASPRKTPESKKDTGYIVPNTGDPDGSIPSAWYSGLDKDSLHNFLKQDIDVLLISVPLTKETRHFLGKEEFEILGKRNALIINIARGPIIVTDDLIAALKKKEGGLRGAALDVTDPEPLNKESELWDLENVIVTPHVSGSGTAYQERSFQILERNLVNLEEGRKLINEVNRRRGY